MANAQNKEIPPFNIELEVFDFPARLGIILSDTDRERVKGLLLEQSKVKADYPSYDEDTYATVEDYNKVFDSWDERTRAKRYEINAELRQIADRLEDEILANVGTKERLYDRVFELVNSFTLTMDRDAQRRHTAVNTDPIFDTFTGYPIMRVSFKRDGVLIEDALLACMAHISRQADIENLLAICNKQGWDFKPIENAVKERATLLLSPEGEEMEKEVTDRIIEQLNAERKAKQEKEASPLSPTLSLLSEKTKELQQEVIVTLDDYYERVPSSTAVNIMLEALSAGDHLGELPARKRKVNHEANYKIKAERGSPSRRIIYSSQKGKESVTLEIADVSKLAGNNGPVKKLFVRILAKANERALYNGIVTNDVIFHLDDLIEDKQYTSRRTAKKGVGTSLDILTGVKITLKGDATRGRVLFPTYDIERTGRVRVVLNEDLNWREIASFFMLLPSYYYRLSNRAGDLLFYICYLARQNLNDIQDHGYFTISFRAIQNRLMLPSEKENKNPQRDIKDPINDAITEMEDANLETQNNTDLQFELVCDDTLPIAEYLDTGYLKVFVNNALADTLLETKRQNDRKRIEAEHKREKREAMKQAQLEKLNEKDNQKN